MIKNKPILILSIFIFLILLWQARLPLWNTHLQVDIWVWWERVEYWLRNHSFSGMSGNEILPATLIYIFAPGLAIPYGWLNYGNYLPAALVLNLGVIGLHLPLIENKPFFLAALLALGPILLFRFDALVTLLLLLSLTAFIKNKFSWAGFWLGLATGLKVFPIILLPYLLWLARLDSARQARRRALFLIYFAEALIVPVLVFFILGGRWEQVVEALNFHNLKLISIESVPGSVITGWSLLTSGQPPRLIPGYGIWAIPGPAALFNRLWLLPLVFVYYLIWKNRPRVFDWNVPLILILVFLVFSKNLNPQYLWWFMALLPFVKIDRTARFVVLGAAILNQLVYPIFYTTLIEQFYQKNQSYWVYYLLLLRNVAIVYLTWKILYPFWSKTKGKLTLK